jgi:hypothetical protein
MMPFSVIGQSVGLVVKLSYPLHLAMSPFAFVESSILIVELSKSMLFSIELASFIFAALLVLLGYINTLCLQLWRRLQLNA